VCNTLMNWAQKSASMGESKHRGCMQCSIMEVVTKRADLEVATRHLTDRYTKIRDKAHNEQTN